MYRIVVAALAGMMSMSPPSLHSQGKTDLSGSWTFDETGSTRNSSVSFPSELAIEQRPGEVEIETSTTRQDVHTVRYKVDGSEVTVPSAGGITITARAGWEGERLVITSKRSFDSPAGVITAELREVYSLRGDDLIVEATQTISGVTDTAMGLYRRSR
jgi:hypothetical protein